MAAVRYAWMFRTAAVVSLLLGLGWLYTALFTDHRPHLRPYILGCGVAATLIGISLFRHMKVAIALSAIGAAFVSIASALAAPNMRGPGILLLAAVSLVAGIYAALAARVLFADRPPESENRGS